MAKDFKKLTGAELKKQAKTLDAQREFTVEIGGQKYLLSHDVTFRKTKQSKVLEDLMDFFMKGAENLDLLEMATPYTALLVLKHFTTLEVSDDLSEAFALLEVLIDLEVLDVILNELPEKEVTELFELISVTTNRMNENISKQEELAKEVLDKEVSQKDE